jgi:hypothetical protein
MSDSTRRDFLAAGLILPAALQAAPEPAAKADLRYRVLGKTGLKVTTVGMGAVLITDPSVVARAADLGVNHFDTARDYQGSNSERVIGPVLKSRRDRVVIATKTGAETRQGVLADLELSLKELQTDYIDILYIPGRKAAAEITDELLEAHRIAKQQGKIRFTGVSTHKGHAEVIPAVVKNPHVDVLESSYNFTMDPSIEALIESARKAGKGVVTMKVMAGGYKNGADAERRRGAMLAALKWVLRNPNVHSTAVSMADTDQLEEDLRAMAEPFSEADRKVLLAQLEHIGPLYCRMCGRCEGACPRGLPVADVLRYLTYADGYGQFAMGRQKFLALPAETRSVRCGDCPSCPVRCPFGVEVAKRLHRAQEIFG